MVERLHCHLKDDLRARGTTTTWAVKLPALGAPGPPVAPREDANISPAQALYSSPLELPNQDISNEHTINEFIIQIDKI